MGDVTPFLFLVQAVRGDFVWRTVGTIKLNESSGFKERRVFVTLTTMTHLRDTMTRMLDTYKSSI